MKHQPNHSTALRIVLTIGIFTAGLFGAGNLLFKLTPQSFKQRPTTKPAEKLPYSSIGQYTYKDLQQDLTNNDNTQFSIELNRTKKEKEAQTLVKSLEKKGIKAYYTPVNVGSGVLFRVRQGLYASKKEARKEAQRIQKATSFEGKIVTL